ncbi:MAG: hypothetical protein FD174_2303 [Geobacteraceae bacterium]|nr:MAG: hypothetical protein FD174_2303 [Geobacteraceae bacterium]
MRGEGREPAGDADTTGAIIGGLAGAYYGIDSIPQRWLKRLDKRVAGEIGKLSRKLAYLAAGEDSKLLRSEPFAEKISRLSNR